jgi:enediyne biosynthesis protein E4
MINSLKMVISAKIGMTAVLSATIANAEPSIPKFVAEITSGVTNTYMGDWEYMVGGGVATFDCNGDSYPDLLTAGGTNKAKFFHNTSKRGGALTFKEEQSGLELEDVTGTYPVDIDSDGIMDIVLLRIGENLAMRGLGNCKFERANEAWNFNGGDAWSSSFAATFEKGQTWPTLAIGNYIDRTQETNPWGSCTANWLHRPDGQKFASPFELKPSFCALSMLFTDWNKSGTPSLRISNDREYYEGGQEQMWRMPAGEAPSLYTDKDGWQRLRVWGMGISSYDLNFDGYPEYFLTSMADHKLQTLTDDKTKPTYKDIAFAAGVTAHRPYEGGDLKPSTGWHSQFEDVNNDGLVDLFVAKGNVDQMPDFAAEDPNNLLLQGENGKFVEAGGKAGVDSKMQSRGAALVDFNLDGQMDLVVANRRTPAQIYRNTNSLGHWVQIKLKQADVNVDALGAQLEVSAGGKILHREITVGGGLASGRNGWWHFGLGQDDATTVRVIWPDGTTSAPWSVKADGFYVVEKGKEILRIVP